MLPTAMSVSEALQKRFSVRAFKDTLVPQEVLEEIFTLARHAPSNCNVQPCRAYVVSGAIGHSPSRKPWMLAHDDIGVLMAWWFVIAACLAAFDLVSSRAGYVPLYASVGEHAWQATLCAGVIGALCAEHNRLLWCCISALGGLIALVVMVAAITLVSGLLAA